MVLWIGIGAVLASGLSTSVVFCCAVEDEPDEKLGKTHSGVFCKDLPWLMYGFGDADKPLKVRYAMIESVECSPQHRALLLCVSMPVVPPSLQMRDNWMTQVPRTAVA